MAIPGYSSVELNDSIRAEIAAATAFGIPREGTVAAIGMHMRAVVEGGAWKILKLPLQNSTGSDGKYITVWGPVAQELRASQGYEEPERPGAPLWGTNAVWVPEEGFVEATSPTIAWARWREDGTLGAAGFGLDGKWYGNVLPPVELTPEQKAAKAFMDYLSGARR